MLDMMASSSTDAGSSQRADNWMRALARHYEWARKTYPERRLLIVFDIDGTILDMRHLVYYVLLWFDREHGTSFFHGLRVEDIDVHENEVEGLLLRLGPGEVDRTRILEWYQKHMWHPEAVLAAHQPFRGVMDVIRWFQIQPQTFVGLNTGRPECLRRDTLRCLNALGQEYRVGFTSDLLYMNPYGWEQKVASVKADGIHSFEQRGYVVVAVLDNEPGNIDSMAAADLEGRILFLHADTLFQSKRKYTPRTVRGRSYDITSLVARPPQHVQFVWHGVNDVKRLETFVHSDIRWGECDVRFDPLGRIVLRGESFDHTPWDETERPFTLRECLTAVRGAGRGIKLDLKEGGALIDRVLDLVEEIGIPDDCLWFNGTIDALGNAGFTQLRAAHPGAIIQCPVDFLGSLVLGAPREAEHVLERFRLMGIDRLSLAWTTPSSRRIIARLNALGYEVNIYGVPDMESFLQAALLLPRSLTSDFIAFPGGWNRVDSGHAAVERNLPERAPSPCAILD